MNRMTYPLLLRIAVCGACGPTPTGSAPPSPVATPTVALAPSSAPEQGALEVGAPPAPTQAVTEYDPIDATRVEPAADGYRLYLFQFPSCGCEPWINSEVKLFVDHDGTITWVSARPWSMTIGFSCAD